MQLVVDVAAVLSVVGYISKRKKSKSYVKEVEGREPHTTCLMSCGSWIDLLYQSSLHIAPDSTLKAQAKTSLATFLRYFSGASGSLGQPVSETQVDTE